MVTINYGAITHTCNAIRIFIRTPTKYIFFECIPPLRTTFSVTRFCFNLKYPLGPVSPPFYILPLFNILPPDTTYS